MLKRFFGIPAESARELRPLHPHADMLYSRACVCCTPGISKAGQSLIFYLAECVDDLVHGESKSCLNAVAGLTGPLAAQWLSALKTHLTQSGGETDLSKLGSVKKPEGVAKNQRLKAFLLQHPKTFAVNGNTVTLKKL